MNSLPLGSGFPPVSAPSVDMPVGPSTGTSPGPAIETLAKQLEAQRQARDLRGAQNTLKALLPALAQAVESFKAGAGTREGWLSLKSGIDAVAGMRNMPLFGQLLMRSMPPCPKLPAHPQLDAAKQAATDYAAAQAAVRAIPSEANWTRVEVAYRHCVKLSTGIKQDGGPNLGSPVPPGTSPTEEQLQLGNALAQAAEAYPTLCDAFRQSGTLEDWEAASQAATAYEAARAPLLDQGFQVGPLAGRLPPGPSADELAAFKTARDTAAAARNEVATAIEQRDFARLASAAAALDQALAAYRPVAASVQAQGFKLALPVEGLELDLPHSLLIHSMASALPLF